MNGAHAGKEWHFPLGRDHAHHEGYFKRRANRTRRTLAERQWSSEVRSREGSSEGHSTTKEYQEPVF